jgi:hypothetical protein
MGDAKRRKDSDTYYGQGRHIIVDARPDQSLDMFDNLPPGTSSEAYLEYISQNWDLMAGFGYEMFLNEGRGALILDWDLSLDAQISLLSPDIRRRNQLDQAIANRELNCPMFYLGDRSALTQALGRDWFSPAMHRLIQGYDPKRMIVLFLCWGASPNSIGNIMGRTLALAGARTPKQLYIENASRQKEFSFLIGTDEAPPSAPESRIVRTFYAEVESSADLRRSLKAEFGKGFAEKGRGALALYPMPEEGSVMPIYVPIAELPKMLGTDVQSRPYQQAIAIMEMCNPQNQVAVILISEDIRTGDSFTYYSCLLNIPEEL